jgi:addiction module HigA family antidote
LTITSGTEQNKSAGPVFVSGLPISPGEVLLEEFLVPMGINQRTLAMAIGVPPIRISEIVRAKRAISADTAMRLAAYFSTTPEFWLNLQSQWELAVLRLKRPVDYSHILPASSEKLT